MTNRRQWTLIAGIVMTALFGVTLAMKLRPQLDLLVPGSKAPAFQAVHLGSGTPAKLEDYRGKVVLLNIWATWCVPCLQEMPSMQRLHEKLKGTDFHIVAVSVDEQDSTVVRQFAQKVGATFEILHNQDQSIRSIYQTTGVPENYIIDRDGVVIKHVIGAAAWDSPANEAMIRALLNAR